MHQNRRKKKRVNYGVRAVEVVRGAKGFGFTISGQQPCILSCIVQGSPAEAAGLRAGDYLVAVNGHNVSKVPHDDVVQLIGSSKGILRLQIAENYYSDSSDEEGLATVRSKPKYAHKPRTASAGALQLQCRAAKVVRDLQSGAMFHTVPGGLAMSDAKDQYNYSGLHYRWNMTSPLPLPPPPASHKRDSEKIVHRTVVGYLGTIDIPNQLHPSCMMQVLRKCIKRLKAEKRNPTTVLLTIHVANIKLTNSENRIIAEYPSYRIIFCNSFSEQDKQYFGILTKSMRNTDDIVSNSCHVFTIYYKLIDHEVHSSACNVFGFMCTKSSELNVCQEFPDSCTSLIGAIQTLYISDCTNGENCTNPYNEARIRLDTASPQPSNISTSTAHSSNSDSGIGFKDDYGSCSSKNLANDCERRRHYSNMQYRNVSARLSKEPVNEAAGHRLTVRATSEARLWSEELKFDPSKEMRHVAGSGEGTTTTCAGTSAPAATARTMFASTSVGSLASVCTTALLDGIEDAAESSKVASTEGLKRLMDATNKLSPKVYCGQVTKSLVHSLEDINSSMEYARQPYCHSYSGKSDKPRPWGSLQEIRNFRSSASDNCINVREIISFSLVSHEFRLLPKMCISNVHINAPRFVVANDFRFLSCTHYSQLRHRFLPLICARAHRQGSSENRNQIGSVRTCSRVLFTPHALAYDYFICFSVVTHRGERGSNRVAHGVCSRDDVADDYVVLATHYRYCQQLIVLSSPTSTSSALLPIPRQNMQSSYGSTESCDKNNDCKGVHIWANGFEKLLEDPKGLQTFAEFLKKEFSHENIYFWAACERYKDTKDTTMRRRLACQIYQRHLSNTAAEPVNVDSHASGQITQELLDEAPADLFLQTQKQVFNLMKFDSYPRFLRSELYRACLEAGSAVIDTEDCDLHLTSSPSVKLKKSHSDAEDRRRKSLLPWNRKNRSKSKDRGESEYNKTPSRSETIYKSFTVIKRETEGNNNEDTVSISSSRSSLASWDLALRQSFNKHSVSSYDGQTNEKKDARSKCTGLSRVILPDGSTTVVTTSQTESIKDVVTRLLDKRALRYSNYDVLILATDEMVDTKCFSSVLAGQEVEVVPTKVLKVELPSRRIISIIAHKGKTLKEVLRPLLNKYGFNLDLISIWSEGRCVPMDIMAISAPTRIIVMANEEDFQRELHTAKYLDEMQHAQPTLDEITNKVFEELLVGKSRNKYQYSEGSCKSDDQRSEGSSILSSKFFLRDSTIHGKKKAKSKCCNTSEKGNSNDCIHEGAPIKSQPPLIAKWRNGVKLQLPGRFDGDELYEGLKRAQRSRLEDQRGTEINFELPDFLKNKENGKPSDSNKMRRTRVVSANYESTTKFYDSSEDKQSSSGYEYSAHVTNGAANERFSALVNITEPLSKCLESSFNLDCDRTLVDGDQTIIENGTDSPSKSPHSGSYGGTDVSHTKLSKPPPLPPKPKNLVVNVVKSGYITSPKTLQRPNHVIE
ncbi:Regulator of G-protein signaling 12 [Trachymyrmex cornetzi]|uniref:Regulator of G-protein signaling 12 n=1 Tax=Trachymyrmex cornetzi TaxID=471704 RepID=A0A195E3B1_9HYME|nr:Regulator of G-protein signaling 12 [Trachymyrmex cornetzi]